MRVPKGWKRNEMKWKKRKGEEDKRKRMPRKGMERKKEKMKE